MDPAFFLLFEVHSVPVRRLLFLSNHNDLCWKRRMFLNSPQPFHLLAMLPAMFSNVFHQKNKHLALDLDENHMAPRRLNLQQNTEYVLERSEERRVGKECSYK